MLSIPMAFQISTKYLPVTWIFFRSPDILLFICAKMSATLQYHSLGFISGACIRQQMSILLYIMHAISHVSTIGIMGVSVCDGIPELEGHTTFGELVHIQRLHDSLDIDGDAISMHMIIRWNELFHRTLIQSHDRVMLIGV